MKRAQDLAGITVFCTFVVASLLGGCTHNDAAGVASAGTAETTVSGSSDNMDSDGMFEVVVTATRPTTTPIVLSAKDSGVTGK
jgi:hypothetical protein